MLANTIHTRYLSHPRHKCRHYQTHHLLHTMQLPHQIQKSSPPARIQIHRRPMIPIRRTIDRLAHPHQIKAIYRLRSSVRLHPEIPVLPIRASRERAHRIVRVVLDRNIDVRECVLRRDRQPRHQPHVSSISCQRLQYSAGQRGWYFPSWPELTLSPRPFISRTRDAGFCDS